MFFDYSLLVKVSLLLTVTSLLLMPWLGYVSNDEVLVWAKKSRPFPLKQILIVPERVVSLLITYSLHGKKLF